MNEKIEIQRKENIDEMVKIVAASIQLNADIAKGIDKIGEIQLKAMMQLQLAFQFIKTMQTIES